MRTIDTELIRKNWNVVLCAVIACYFISCSQDELYIKENSNKVHRLDKSLQQNDAYQKALRKLPSIYSFVHSDKSRLSVRSNIPEIESAIPLWYGDTASVTPTPGTGAEDTFVANDSIYGYVFNFAEDKGSIVVGVDNNLPDLLAYSIGHNFFENPIYISPEAMLSRLKWYLHIAMLYTNREVLMRKILADFACTYKEGNASALIHYKHSVEEYERKNIELGDENYTLPKIVKIDFTDPVVTRSEVDVNGKAKLHLFDTLPYTVELLNRFPDLSQKINNKCWDIIPSVAMYMSCLQDVSTYNGWDIDWSTMFDNQEIEETESEEYLDKISHLYYLLSLPENLNWMPTHSSRFEIFKNVPRTLENFGFLNGGKVYDNMSINDILYELDDKNICLIMADFNKLNEKYSSSYGYGMWSVVVDDYKENSCEWTYHYEDNLTIKRTHFEWFLDMKFTAFGVYLGDMYMNWALLDPNCSMKGKELINPRIPVEFPEIDKGYKNLSVLLNVVP